MSSRRTPARSGRAARLVRLDSPRAAADAGIHTVFQDLSLCDNLDAVQNLFLGHERCGPPGPAAAIRRHVMEEQAQRVLESLSVKVRSLDGAGRPSCPAGSARASPSAGR